MGNILSQEQCKQISQIKQKIHDLNLDGWLCEGHDIGLNQFFNNELDDGFFIADYDGNIISSEMNNIPNNLIELAKLNGQICRICGYEEKTFDDPEMDEVEK